MFELLDGKLVSKAVKDEVKEEVDKLKLKGITPKLAVILVGDDSASKIYVRNKSRSCEYCGIEYEEFLFPEDTKVEVVKELINNLNRRKDINGILVQSPLPNGMDKDEMFSLVDESKDVDGFNPKSVGELFIGSAKLKACTPAGIIRLLEYYNIDLSGKNITVIGRSNIVGKPMIGCLLEKNATVTVCHSKTKDIKEHTKNADVIISATGRLNMVTADMVKDGVIIVDVGMNRKPDGKLAGDVDFEKVSKKAKYITPVPGGVGPMTIAMLMNNIVIATKIQNNLI